MQCETCKKQNKEKPKFSIHIARMVKPDVIEFCCKKCFIEYIKKTYKLWK